MKERRKMKGKRVLHHDWTEEELEKVPCYKILIITYEQLSQLDLKSNNIILSLSVVCSKSICHKWQNFFLFKGWIILHCICRCNFFIRSSIDIQLGSLHILAIMNNAVMSRGGGVQKSPTDVTVFP